MEFIILTFGIIIYALFKAINYSNENYEKEISNIMNKGFFAIILVLMPIILIILLETMLIYEPELKTIKPMIEIFINAFIYIIIGFFLLNLYGFFNAIKKLYEKGKYDL